LNPENQSKLAAWKKVREKYKEKNKRGMDDE